MLAEQLQTARVYRHLWVPQRKLHFVGIGGSGMSGIAEILLHLGYEVSGCDLRLSATTDRLQALGARISQGHDPAHVHEADAVVVSSAIPQSSEEVQEARRLQIPVIPRGEMLAELMRLKFGIAVAGSHGKTTTTSMIGTVLAEAGLDPTVIVGGKLFGIGESNARVGASEFLVAESDESDRSFLKLSPIVAVITNIDREHLDHYGSYEALQQAFLEFASRVPFYGSVVLCLDDQGALGLLPQLSRPCLTYGFSPQADLNITNVSPQGRTVRFDLNYRGTPLGQFKLNVPGRHNVLNAAAATGVALTLGISPEDIRAGLEKYSGVERRLQVRWSFEGITGLDDYGHHPAEIQVTLDTVRQCGYERVLVVFQPHRYTRTKLLLDDFGLSFHKADLVILLDIYPASEPPIPGITSQLLLERMRAFGHRNAIYAASFEEAAQLVAEQVRPGDAVLTLGAGSVWQVSDLVLQNLRQRFQKNESARQ